jgi:ABC-type nickel/cobalt efflux system permease component RcnA
MMEKESGGIGFVGVLQITFVVLKLCKVIDWSWWWVLSPIWISTALTILVVLIGIIVIYVRDKRWSK